MLLRKFGGLGAANRDAGSLGGEPRRRRLGRDGARRR